jgi:hypothetical protein
MQYAERVSIVLSYVFGDGGYRPPA